MTTITASVAAGVQLREDMDKGVFDRFRSLPIARIAPLAGPMMADLVRYALATGITLIVGALMGYRPGGGVLGVAAGMALAVHHRLVYRLGLPVDRHYRQDRRRRPGHVHDDHVSVSFPVERFRPR